jgi:hypothetical protein
VDDKDFINPEPRILLNYLLTGNLSLKASYSRMYQNVHLLTSSGTGMPTDLWLPATRKVLPQRLEQYALGMATTRTIADNKYELSVEAFFKDLRNLISYKSGANVFGSSVDWQDKVEIDGIGTSQGLEFLINKRTGNPTGWIGYTFSRTTHQFANINEGIPYLFKYDRPHDLSLVFIQEINENINFSLTWVYGSGNAITLPVKHPFDNNRAGL